MDEKILDNISSPEDLKALAPRQLTALCSELRETIIDIVSKNGGHLASNLGVVELTVALHSVFNMPEDKIVWDVGHQSYVHKLLTGRRDRFHSIRTDNGLSGFTLREESEFDCFSSGHAGNFRRNGIRRRTRRTQRQRTCDRRRRRRLPDLRAFA